jgi:hypothetical protein
VIGYRYGGWFGPLDAKKEVDKTGRKTAADVVFHRRDRCPVMVDIGGGWGGDAVIAMKDNGIDVVAFNGVVKSTARTRDGKLGFFNKRAEAVWRLREALDPSQEGGSVVALPPDPELKADLASYQWELVRLHNISGIKLLDKDKQREALGRSPDRRSRGRAGVPRRSAGRAAEPGQHRRAVAREREETMRTRPFLNASEPARPYSELLAERMHDDPKRNALAQIDDLEAEASEATDPAERKRLQCEAEALRCALDEGRR